MVLPSRGLDGLSTRRWAVTPSAEIEVEVEVEDVPRALWARRRAELQAGQDAAVRAGLAPFVRRPFPIYSTEARASRLAIPTPPPPCWGARTEDDEFERLVLAEQAAELEQIIRTEPDLARAQAVLDARRDARRASQDEVWAAARRAESDCYLCRPDDEAEPEGGAERRSSAPSPRTIRFGAELQGNEVNVIVPSDSSDAEHVVTCRRLYGNGVVLYVGVSCTCEDFTYRKSKTSKVAGMLPDPCKHMKRASRFGREQALAKLGVK
jgi:hypothetical protein